MSAPAIALNRFGLGARPDDPVPPDPKAWLLAQLAAYDPSPPAIAVLPDKRAIAAQYAASLPSPALAKADPDMRKDAIRMFAAEGRVYYSDAANARMVSALTTTTPFMERLVYFWSNHFAISADKIAAVPFAGAFEAEAIRPNIMGRFGDMLLAVEQHPGMQLFLDQAQSIGPNSRVATAAASRNPDRRLGLNENLAREIMELHTLGVRSGYTQADVTEFAKAMTGWSVDTAARTPAARLAALGAPGAGSNPGAFLFRPAMHEPGTRTIMGKNYRDGGVDQATAVLADLAAAPATANHLAIKLARHFVADDPPPALVARLSGAYLSSGGDLPTVYRALVEAPESWSPAAAKFKTPWDWMVSAMRGAAMRDIGAMQVLQVTNQLGQPLWKPGSPAGWDDIAASWAAPDALVRRVEFAQRIANMTGDKLDARTLAPKLLPGTLGAATATQLARAESAPSALALLLVSPEFQRRS